MDTEMLRYQTGEEVHAGDRVQYRGDYATVVFVKQGDAEEASPGYADYAGSERGIVICSDDGTLTQPGEPDEDLVLLDRN